MADRAVFRFLDLPAELRNVIYQMILEGRISIDDDYRIPGLLLACKQIQQEPIECFYQTASFQFSNLELYCWWLKHVRVKHRKLITRLHYQIDHDDSDYSQGARKAMRRDVFLRYVAQDIKDSMNRRRITILPLPQQIVLRIELSEDDFEDIVVYSRLFGDEYSRRKAQFL